MQCHEFVERLQTRLDLRESARNDPALTAHAQQCIQCGAQWQAWHRIEIGLPSCQLPELPEDFALQTIRQFQQVSRPNRARRAAGWAVAVAAGWAVAVAAGLLLAVLTLTRPAIQREPLAQSAPTAANRPRPGKLLATGPSLPAAVELSQHAEPGEAADPEAYRLLLQQLLAQLPESRLQELESMDEIAGTIRPIAATLNAALVALRRSLPLGTAETPSKPPVDSAQRSSPPAASAGAAV